MVDFYGTPNTQNPKFILEELHFFYIFRTYKDFSKETPTTFQHNLKIINLHVNPVQQNTHRFKLLLLFFPIFIFSNKNQKK